MKNVLSIFCVLCGLVTFGQNQPKIKEIVPPAEVSAAFEKEFPRMKPVWSQEFTGQDEDEIRYEANFSDIVNKMVVYDKLGNLKAVEISIQINELPTNAIHYLRSNTYEKSITEIVKVTDNIKITTYEAGINKDGKFFDLVFDSQGNFIQMAEKD